MSARTHHKTPSVVIISMTHLPYQEHATSILNLCHGIFTKWSIFSIPFLSWNRAVTVQRRSDVKLVSCDRSWRSHGSLIPGKFDLTINQFIKTPWQECSIVPYFCLSATDQIQKLHQTSLNKHTKYKSKDHIANICRFLHHLRIYFWKKQCTVLFPRFNRL